MGNFGFKTYGGVIMDMIEKLWEAACSGDIDTLSNYYERKKIQYLLGIRNLEVNTH